MWRVAVWFSLRGDVMCLRVANRVVLVVKHLEHEGDVTEAGVGAGVGRGRLLHHSGWNLLVR